MPGMYGSIIIPYSLARKTILDVDVLLYKGEGTVSEGIKLITDSEFSHAGFVVWWDNRLMVLEAVAPQMRAIALTESLAHYHGDVYLYRVNGIPPRIRAQIKDHVKLQLGNDYPTTHLFKMAARKIVYKITNKKLCSPDKYRPANAMVCSHVVASSFNKYGYDFVPGVSDQWTDPGLIATSEISEEIGILKLEEE